MMPQALAKPMLDYRQQCIGYFILLLFLPLPHSIFAQAELVRRINPDEFGDAFLSYHFMVDNIMYFTADDGTNGNELWKSDGTTAGTLMVDDINPGPSGSFPSRLTLISNDVFFVAETAGKGPELWVWENFAEPMANTLPHLVRDIAEGPGSSFASQLTPYTCLPTGVGGPVTSWTLYFRANDGETGSELWSSFIDPTAIGGEIYIAVQTADIDTSQGGSSLPDDFLEWNDVLYFTADDGMNGRELWYLIQGASTTCKDHVPSELDTLTDIRPGPLDALPRELTVSGNRLFFTAITALGRELWVVSNPSEGAMMVKDINTINEPSSGLPNISNPSPRDLIDFNGTLFFLADDGSTGHELWRSEGTEASTVLVQDINPGGNSSNIFAYFKTDDLLYFVANDGEHGLELWRTNGNSLGTRMVKDIFPGTSGSFPQPIAVMDGELYFAANDGMTGSTLWRTDGTSEGTFMVKNMGDQGGHNPFSSPSLVVEDTVLYYSAEDDSGIPQLWRTNGTAEGTQRLSCLTFSSFPSEGLQFEMIEKIGDTIYFATSADLWKFDPATYPFAPIIVLDATIENPACPGDSTGTISLDVSGGGQPYAFVWEHLLMPLDTPFIGNLYADTFMVMILDCLGDTLIESFILTDPDIPALNADFSFTADLLAVTFTDQTTGSPNSWLWDFGDGTTSDEQHPVHTFTEEGVFDVSLLASNNCDTSTFAQSITIVSTGLETLEKEAFQVSVFPNPFNENLSIQYQINAPFEKAQLTLFNLIGQQLESLNIKKPEATVEMGSFLPAGLFFLHLEVDGRISKALRVAKGA